MMSLRCPTQLRQWQKVVREGRQGSSYFFSHLTSEDTRIVQEGSDCTERDFFAQTNKICSP